jgi:hypothetical protein
VGSFPEFQQHGVTESNTVEATRRDQISIVPALCSAPNKSLQRRT